MSNNVVAADITEAGLEFDAVVAARVMRLKVNSGTELGYTYVRDGLEERWFVAFVDWRGDNRCDPVAKYSTHIAAAWAIVERLRSEGFIVAVRSDPAWTCEIRRPEWSNSLCVTADTAPFAICRAALAAVEIAWYGSEAK